MRHQKGWTLIELLVTLTISSLLLGFSINGFSALQERSKATLAINRLAFGIQNARHAALTRRQVITLCPSSDGINCGRNWDDTLILFSGDPSSPSKKIIQHYAASPHSGKIIWRSFRQDNKLQMNVNGLTLAYNGTFIYCPPSNNPKNAKALVLNKSGRTRIAQDLNGDGIPDISKTESVSCQS